MFVYLKEEPVTLEMREVDAEGMVPPESGLVAVAFYADGNEQPSFRSLLPPETVLVLAEATQVPVQLGLLAEEPEEEGQEIRAMVGISVPVQDPPPEEEGAGAAAEPWRADPDAWRGDAEEEFETGEHRERAALLAFAPLVRLHRKHPDDFGDELADLLETALAGETKPSLEARVDRLLGDL